MQTIGSDELATQVPSLLNLVAHGEEITIVRDGVPVARLVPVEPTAKADVRSAIEEIREFRKGRTLGGLSIKDMIEEGRRV